MSRSSTSLFLVNFITGISDGLLLPFAAGIVALPLSDGRPLVPFCAGAAVSLLGGCVFGLARYFGEKEEIHHRHPDLATAEAEKELSLLRDIGIAPELIEGMKPEMEAERALWLQEVTEHGMGWEVPDGKRARSGGIHTGLGFLAGGLWVSAIGYVLMNGVFPIALLGLYFATAGTFGWLRAHITGKPWVPSALVHIAKAVIICCCAFLAALLIHTGRNPWMGLLFDPAR